MIGSSQGGQPTVPRLSVSSQSSIRPPNYISDQATEGSVNNVLARGYQIADRRYQTKLQDRPGFSRGKGSQYIAGQQASQEMGKAAAEAASVRAQDQLQNAQMRADYERAREIDAQSTGMAAHQVSQANWYRQFAQQQAAVQLMTSLMR